MSVQVVYKNNLKLGNTGTFALFTDENFNIDNLAKIFKKRKKINYYQRKRILKKNFKIETKVKKKNSFFRFEP